MEEGKSLVHRLGLIRDNMFHTGHWCGELDTVIEAIQYIKDLEAKEKELRWVIQDLKEDMLQVEKER